MNIKPHVFLVLALAGGGAWAQDTAPSAEKADSTFSPVFGYNSTQGALIGGAYFHYQGRRLGSMDRSPHPRSGLRFGGAHGWRAHPLRAPGRLARLGQCGLPGRAGVQVPALAS